jgi:aminoglycoside phosphotransferase (APT) family kinase protein
MHGVPKPHYNWKALLLRGYLDNELIEQFGRILATIHRRAAKRRHALAVEFADCSFFESLRLEPYYACTARQLLEVAAFFHDLIDETCRRADTLVHGDYSPKNILVRDRRLILIDHEVIHWGDPAFDLGFSFAHLLSKANHLPAHRKALTAATRQHWMSYRQTLGAVRHPLGVGQHVAYHGEALLLVRVEQRRGGACPLSTRASFQARNFVAAGRVSQRSTNSAHASRHASGT